MPAHRIPPAGRVLAALLVLAGCAAGDDATAPAAPRHPPRAMRGSAFRVAVDVRRGTAAVTAPSGAGRRAGGASFSLVAGDGVALGVSNVTSAPLGAGKARVRMDVALTNRFAVAELVAPTTPAPPPGASGLVLIPYALELPNDRVDAGLRASSDWDGDGTPGSGAPWNFFNDFAGCGKGVNPDCLRWELFRQPLVAGATSETRTVGFDVPANAAAFVVYVFVAADLRENLTPPVAGTVVDNLAAPMAGLLVDAGGGVSATTDARGAYALALPLGMARLAVTGTPAGCDPIAPTPIGVTPGGTAGANFVVPCFGAVSGRLTVPGAAAPEELALAAGVTVAVGGLAAQSGADGSFALPRVPTGPTAVQVTPSPYCDPPPPSALTVARAGAHVVPFALDCWGTVTGVVWDYYADAPAANMQLDMGLYTTRTDAAGAFALRAKRGGYVFKVRGAPAGCQLVGFAIAGVSLGANFDAQQLNIGCPATLKVVVEDGSGTPVPNTFITVDNNRRSVGQLMQGGASSWTVGISAGKSTVQVGGVPSACTFFRTETPSVAPGTTFTFVATLQCAHAVSGHLSLSVGGASAVSLGNVQVRLSGPNGVFSDLTDLGGNYSIAAVPAGIYQLSLPGITLPNVCVKTVSATITYAGPSTVDFPVRC